LINQTGQSEEQILGKLESLKTVIAQVNAQFKSPVYNFVLLLLSAAVLYIACFV